MLAYHSVEHMGLIALGAAAGSPLAIAAVLLHILGHGLAKGVLFLASGEILLIEGTSEIEQVPALLSRRPVLGGIFAFGLVALLGFPPFSLFVSELNMLRAEFQVGLGWAAAVSLVCMAVIFGAVMSHGRHMLLGPKRHSRAGHDPGARRRAPRSAGWWAARSSASRPGRCSRCSTPPPGSWPRDRHRGTWTRSVQPPGPPMHDARSMSRTTS